MIGDEMVCSGFLNYNINIDLFFRTQKFNFSVEGVFLF
jgi:hypothetical protein